MPMITACLIAENANWPARSERWKRQESPNQSLQGTPEIQAPLSSTLAAQDGMMQNPKGVGVSVGAIVYNKQ